MPTPKKTPTTAKKNPRPAAAAAAMAALLRTARREADAELYGAYCAGFSQALAGTSCAGLSPSEELDVREVVAYAMSYFESLRIRQHRNSSAMIMALRLEKSNFYATGPLL